MDVSTEELFDVVDAAVRDLLAREDLLPVLGDKG